MSRLFGPYWRCRMPTFFDIFWPMFGHRIKFNRAMAFCDRCPWTDPLDWLEP